MRVTIIAIGSRGDVQPCVALGMGLQSAGHEIRLATHSSFRVARSQVSGLDFASVAEGNLSRGSRDARGPEMG